jgi:hypothetical protein
MLIEKSQGEVEVEILSLVDYHPVPCRVSGKCFFNGECAYDPDFNEIYTRLRHADAIFLVCPHYAPIPSKLVIVLEKLQEMTFLNYSSDPGYSSPLAHKPVGLIGHGGQTEEALPYYRQALLEPLSNAVSSIGMHVISPDGVDKGIVFGIKRIESQTDSIFVKLEHDWDMIRERVTPLVEKVAEAVGIQMTVETPAG